MRDILVTAGVESEQAALLRRDGSHRGCDAHGTLPGSAGGQAAPAPRAAVSGAHVADHRCEQR
eukprot:6357925-Heterocapsa_arctica.AAC.1